MYEKLLSSMFNLLNIFDVYAEGGLPKTNDEKSFQRIIFIFFFIITDVRNKMLPSACHRFQCIPITENTQIL